MAAETSQISDSDHNPGCRLIGKVPVRNLWLLMLYASDLFRHKGTGKVSFEENPDEIPDLVAEILANIVEKRLRKNLTYGYTSESAVLNTVRGKIDHISTTRHQLLLKGKIACKFENLSVNTPRNRLVRAALYCLARNASRPILRKKCKALGDMLGQSGVSGVKPSRSEITADRFGRHDSEDRVMLAAAKLAFEINLPSEIESNTRFLSLEREGAWVRKLFEKAVAGFYEVVLGSEGWQIFAGKKHRWPIENQTPGIAKLLQNMQTDIILESHEKHKRIIIDTKFNEILISGLYRARAFRTGYLYQMYAYLRSQEGSGDSLSDYASGMLLHPAAGETIDEIVLIQKHAIRFATVDLAETAMAIRNRLISLSWFPEGF